MSESLDLVRLVNKQCPKFSHEHRKSTEIENIKYKLYNLKNSGCYLCNPKIISRNYAKSKISICLLYTKKERILSSDGNDIFSF